MLSWSLLIIMLQVGYRAYVQTSQQGKESQMLDTFPFKLSPTFLQQKSSSAAFGVAASSTPVLHKCLIILHEQVGLEAQFDSQMGEHKDRLPEGLWKFSNM